MVCIASLRSVFAVCRFVAEPHDAAAVSREFCLSPHAADRPFLQRRHCCRLRILLRSRVLLSCLVISMPFSRYRRHAALPSQPLRHGDAPFTPPRAFMRAPPRHIEYLRCLFFLRPPDACRRHAIIFHFIVASFRHLTPLSIRFCSFLIDKPAQSRLRYFVQFFLLYRRHQRHHASFFGGFVISFSP